MKLFIFSCSNHDIQNLKKNLFSIHSDHPENFILLTSCDQHSQFNNSKNQVCTRQVLHCHYLPCITASQFLLPACCSCWDKCNQRSSLFHYQLLSLCFINQLSSLCFINQLSSLFHKSAIIHHPVSLIGYHHSVSCFQPLQSNREVKQYTNQTEVSSILHKKMAELTWPWTSPSPSLCPPLPVSQTKHFSAFKKKKTQPPPPSPPPLPKDDSQSWVDNTPESTEAGATSECRSLCHKTVTASMGDWWPPTSVRRQWSLQIWVKSVRGFWKSCWTTQTLAIIKPHHESQQFSWLLCL